MTFIEVPALAVTQSPGKTIYSFAIDAKRIPEFAAVSRISRGEDGKLLGYQRPEVRKHIKNIRAYIDSQAPMVPNALVLAFDERVTFESSGSAAGVLRIPVYDEAPEGEQRDRVGWIVDGQQRVAAISGAARESFVMFASAFIANSDAEAREQFMLVNSTKPLPKSLIYELLPGVDGANLPEALKRRQLPAEIMQLLNQDTESPLYQAIATATCHGARVKDNSILKALANSLSDGMLYRIRAVHGDAADAPTKAALFAFWAAVRDTWPDLWELKPRKSRLLHGAGVVSLGLLMDCFADQCPDGEWPDHAHFMKHLAIIKPACRWSEGVWEFGADLRPWNHLQNTSKDINMLANHLQRFHRRAIRASR